MGILSQSSAKQLRRMKVENVIVTAKNNYVQITSGLFTGYFGVMLPSGNVMIDYNHRTIKLVYGEFTFKTI